MIQKKQDSPSFGVIVLCPDANPKSLKITVKSVKNYIDRPCIAIVPKTTSKDVSDEMVSICPTYKGRQTYTSLINVGLARSKEHWNFVFLSNSVLRPNFWIRYFKFAESDKDVLFTVINGKYRFEQASLNGLFMNKDTFKTIGNFPEMPDIEKSKLIWAYNAIGVECKIKGILGVKIT